MGWILLIVAVIIVVVLAIKYWLITFAIGAFIFVIYIIVKANKHKKQQEIWEQLHVIDPSSIRRINCGEICPQCPADIVGRWVYAFPGPEGKVVQSHKRCGYYEIREDLEWDSFVKGYIRAGAIRWPDGELILPDDLTPYDRKEIFEKREEMSFKKKIILFVIFLLFILVLFTPKLIKERISVNKDIVQTESPQQKKIAKPIPLYRETNETLADKKTIVPSLPLLGLYEAKQRIPDILERIYHDLDQGNPRASSSFLASEILSDSRLLDTICKPFKYRAHYIENIIERPSDKFEVRTRVLFQPVDEHAQVLIFRPAQDDFVLESVSQYPREHFAIWAEEAKQTARKFYYAMKANRQDIIEKLVSSKEVIHPELTSSFGPYRSTFTYKEFQQKLQSSGEISSIYVEIIPYKGLKARVYFGSYIAPDWVFYVDNIDNEYKIVEWQYSEHFFWKTVHGTDPDIESYTLKRFESRKELSASQEETTVLEKEIKKSKEETPATLDEKEKQEWGGRNKILEEIERKKIEEDQKIRIDEEREEKKPIRAIGEIKPPKLVKKVDPIYPEIAIRAKVEGVVILEVTTNIYGRVKNIKVLRSIPLLDRSAIDAVRQWVFETVLIDGKPRGVIFTQTVFFKLSMRQ